MSQMSFSTSKQYVRPPQRGVFALDHFKQCSDPMKAYLDCLKESKDMHHKCKQLSKEYLECRMNNKLMSEENLDHLGFGKETEVVGAHEYDRSKEKAGFIAGKHIKKQGKWWFNFEGRNWYAGKDDKTDKE
eukprot:Nitzschia sp. Nitz4//scaffold53_size117307//105884//106804//NITZ4_003782-RA/size117307-augustus-gene-0.94-mRNA-1//1//CDS//3329554241//5503//frame0